MKPLIVILQAGALIGALLVLPGCSSGGESGSGSGGDSSKAKPSANASTGGSSGDAGKSKGSPEPPNTVEVPLDQQQVAGIRVVQLEPRTVPRTLSVPGQIMMDEQRTAHISPYADGKVVDVLKMTGDPVRKGTVLAHLHSHSVHETVGTLVQAFANVARAQSAITYAEKQAQPLPAPVLHPGRLARAAAGQRAGAGAGANRPQGCAGRRPYGARAPGRHPAD